MLSGWLVSALVRFRPGPPRILRTLELAHRFSSVGRGLAPFPLDIPILNRPLKGHFIYWGFVIPVSVDLSDAHLGSVLVMSFKTTNL
jgi:hypothetical protein